MSIKVILYAPIYFSYHIQIIKSLEKKGYIVDFMEDKNTGILYTLSSKSTYLLEKYKAKYENEVLSKLKYGNYDVMIVIGGKTLDYKFWEFVGQNFSFKKILYQWDSLRNFNYKEMIPSFDTVKTFDSLDAVNLGIQYLPLFYSLEERPKIEEDIDLLFIGIWHSDRIFILNQIAEYAKRKGLKYYFKVYYPWYMYYYLVYVKKHFKPSDFFIFKTIPLQETLNYYERAKCIVDINHPWQSGLTMRTIETIGKKKKIITTNSYIANEKFYNENMIQIVDREKVQIEDDFFNRTGSYDHIECLEISNWIDKLLK